MPTTTTDVKEYIRHRLDTMSAPDALKVLEFIDTLAGHEPNEETIAAFRESQNPENLPSYRSIQEMFEDFGVKC